MKLKPRLSAAGASDLASTGRYMFAHAKTGLDYFQIGRKPEASEEDESSSAGVITVFVGLGHALVTNDHAIDAGLISFERYAKLATALPPTLTVAYAAYGSAVTLETTNSVFSSDEDILSHAIKKLFPKASFEVENKVDPDEGWEYRAMTVGTGIDDMDIRMTREDDFYEVASKNEAIGNALKNITVLFRE